MLPVVARMRQKKILPIGKVVFRLTGKRRSEGPASISAMRSDGSADRRLAMMQPAAPAPTMMKLKARAPLMWLCSPLAHRPAGQTGQAKWIS